MVVAVASEAKGTVGWAEEAVEWAKRPYPAVEGRTNYGQLLERVCAIASEPGKVRVMRNQAELGMNNNYWPCLSRLMIMDEPELVRWIEPRFCEALDRQAGIAMLQLMFQDVTGRRPRARSWRHAKEAMGL